jgi:energy-coupling factor transporter transmembrane protein EcfT
VSPWGYLLFTGWAALMSVMAKDWWLLGLTSTELAFGLISSRRGLQLFRRPRFWILILTAVALGPLLIGDPDVTLGPLHLSREGLAAGLEMAGRALALTLAFNLGIGALSLSDVVAVFERLGLRGLGFATALAMNLLGMLQEMAVVTLQTLWLRGGTRRPWTALRLFLVTTVANTLRYRDDIVNAAAVRAFDPLIGQPLPLSLRSSDLWLLAVLAGCTGILLTRGI